MALKIEQTCIGCDMCLPECPNDAITMGDPVYTIHPERCTECVGYYDTPQCQKVCPISRCILPDPEHVESEASLLQKMQSLLNSA